FCLHRPPPTPPLFPYTTLFRSDLRRVARAALTSGVAALSGFTLRPGTPLSPMLAVSAPTAPEALEITGAPALVDTKLDGVRIQVDRKSTRLNSSHVKISYAVFC